MADFLYFLPLEANSLSPANVSAAGLDYASDGRGFLAVQTSKGPGDAQGFILAFDRADQQIPDLKFNSAAQTWRKAKGGKFWVGLSKDDRPGPDDLARSRVISGEAVKLHDGNEWTIPICLSIVRGTTLPRALVLGQDGETWELATLPEFVRLCKDAATVWEAFRTANDGTVTMDGQEAPRIAADALAVNYRIGPMEISMLALWSSTDMWNVLKAIIDGYAVERIAKERAEKNAVTPSAP